MKSDYKEIKELLNEAIELEGIKSSVNTICSDLIVGNFNKLKVTIEIESSASGAICENSGNKKKVESKIEKLLKDKGLPSIFGSEKCSCESCSGQTKTKTLSVEINDSTALRILEIINVNEIDKDIQKNKNGLNKYLKTEKNE